MNLDDRYRAFWETARSLGKEKQYETCYRAARQQGLCHREAIEVAAWNLNLPGHPW